VIDQRSVEQAAERFRLPEGSLDRLRRRRDRKRRNQRIAAGVVGIAVFVAAVWIVTSVASLDRSEKSVAPAGGVKGPAETGPAETGPPPAGASAAPHFVRQEMCSGGAKVRLELTNFGDRIKVRFEVHRSPVGHEWHIQFRPLSQLFINKFFTGTRVASDSGVFVVQRRYLDLGHEGLVAKAVDLQTDQVCRASVWYG
jgi:hypothetical protein